MPASAGPAASKELKKPCGVRVSARGMVSSIGYDVESACAAARAGIVRLSDLPYYRVRSPDDGRGEPATGHLVRGRTEGYEGFSRLLRLSHLALTDLERRVAERRWDRVKTGFFLSVPDPGRRVSGLEIMRDEKTRESRKESAAGAPPREPMAKELFAKLMSLAPWPGPAELRFVTTSGHCGVAEALAAAIEALQSRQVDAAVVGGVDSLLEEDTLQWLEETGRLKSPACPAGVHPGEAAAFLVLDKEPLGGERLGSIAEIKIGEEAKTLLSGQPVLGVGLTEVAWAALDENCRSGASQPWILTDQTGEPYRSTEWGHALVKLAARIPSFSGVTLWYPAAAFGDTGAASGAVSLCVASSAFARGYAPAARAVLLASSEGASRASVTLSDPSP